MEQFYQPELYTEYDLEIFVLEAAKAAKELEEARWQQWYDLNVIDRD